jgi:hypothetical protein
MTEDTKFNFEQIPVETVRKIARELPPTAPGDPEQLQDGSDAATDWKALALQVQEEKDPKRMLHIVEQLVRTLDRNRQRTYQRTSEHNPPAGTEDRRQSQRCANQSTATADSA